MKCLYIVLFFFSASVIYGQRANEIKLLKEKIVLGDNSIYIFCRGTKSKAGMIAKEFNLADTNVTHAGLAFIQNNKLFIYNVTDISRYGETALVIDSLESFIGSPDVNYLDIWECDVNLNELQIAKENCLNYWNKKIVFDRMFKISDDDTLYCSEFCALILKRANAVKFYFEPAAIELKDKLKESILKRKCLVYYPVDFFQYGKHCRRIFSYKFQE